MDITRDFAVANKLETEAGVNLTSSVSKKAHQVFSIYEAGGGAGEGAKQEKAECRHLQTTGKCKFGNTCRFKHVKKAGIAPSMKGKKGSELKVNAFIVERKGIARKTVIGNKAKILKQMDKPSSCSKILKFSI